MANDQHLVQIAFEVDADSIDQGIDQSTEKLRRGVDRLNGIGNGGQAPTPTPSANTPEPSAPPGAQSGSAGGSGASNAFDITAARNQLEEIRSAAGRSPDLALLRLVGAGGSGGLLSQVQRSAMGGEDEHEHQEMLEAIRDLTRGIRTQIQQTDKEGGLDPASSILGFMRSNALMQTGLGIAGDLASGNLLGAGGSAAGGLLGLAFGPLGAQAGASLGGMLGNSIGGFVGQAGESRQYAEIASEIAARFGDPSLADDELGVDRISGAAAAGYSTQDTAALLDSLRQQNLIDDVDEEALELSQSIQELTRATGMNTEALVSSYAQYRTLGGDQSVDDYQANMIAGAIAVGMRQNLDQYQEMVGSARSQLVYGGGVGDYDNQGQEGIQDLLYGLMGQQNRMSELLSENPMMAQQMLQSLMGTGSASSQFGLEAAMMQLAGIDRAQTTAGYIDPGQQVDNMIQRQRFIQDTFLGQSNSLGFGSMDELRSAAQSDPELVQEMLTQSPEAAQYQAQLDTSIAVQYGKSPEQLTAQERQTSMQLLQTYLAEGDLTADSQTGEEGVSIADLIAESQMTEGERSREAAAERHREMMDLMNEWSPLLTSMDETIIDMLEAVKPISEELAPVAIEAFELITTWLGGMLENPVGQYAQNVQENGFVAATAESVIERGINMNPLMIAQRGASRLFGGEGRGIDLSPSIFSFGRRREEEEGDRPVREGRRRPSPTEPPTLNQREARFTEGDADASFGDTPPGGVIARDDFNIFAFQPGDRVTAEQTNYGSVGEQMISGGNISASIIVQLSVPPSVRDAGWVEDAARRGAQAGGDDFMQRWRAMHGNQPKLRQGTF